MIVQVRREYRLGYLVFWLLNKTKVKTKPKQDEMDDGAPPADFGRQHKIGAEQRHRYFGKVEIELNSRADEECAGQEFSKFPAMPCEIERWQTEDDQCDEKCGDHILRKFIQVNSSVSMPALALTTG